MAKVNDEQNMNTRKQVKAKGEGEELVVDWDAVVEPLDVSVRRNGLKVPRRKVKVRAIVRDEWIEREAGLPSGGIKHLVATIRKLALHGYEARLDQSIRFVHMYDDKDGIYPSPQLMKPYKDDVVKGIKFRLLFEGSEVGSLEEVRALNAKNQVKVRGEGEGGAKREVDEVTPDPMMTCPKCGYEFRAGKRQCRCH